MENLPPSNLSDSKFESNQIISDGYKVPYEEAIGAFTRLHDRIASEIYVIMNKSMTTVLKDPGLNRPFSHRSKKFAESVQKETGGMVVTLEFAIKHLIEKGLKLNQFQ